MRRRARLCLRTAASLLLLLLALEPVVECGVEAMTPEQHACCAAMKGECKKSIAPHCCGGAVESSPSVAAMKGSEGVVPAAVLVAILTPPPIAPPTTRHLLDAPGASSSGPPGVPTYLFVSSFRI